jgi:TonB family protein
MTNKTRKIFWLAIFFSLAAHIVGGVGISLFPGLRHAQPKKTVEVELIDIDKVSAMVKQMKAEQSAKGQIVQQSAKRLNDEVPVDAKFLSRFDQKIKQETQAKKNGAFKNTASDRGAGDDKPRGRNDADASTKKAATDVKEEKVAKAIYDDPNGIPFKGKKPSLKDLTPSFRPTIETADAESQAAGNGEGESATDDRLKNVKSGMQTLLSTREFVYYSYYNRIREKLRQYWEPKIKEKFERIVRQGRTIASDGDKITSIIIILDDKGILKGVQVLSGSGVRDLDDAAVEAFRAAAPFPNPPKGIVESDGTIKIRWDFVLQA